MKRTFLVLSFSGLLILAGTVLAYTQEEPVPIKDTVNMDTDAKPTFYYAVEDEKTEDTAGKSSSGTTIAIIAGVVVVAAGAGFYLLKKKK